MWCKVLYFADLFCLHGNIRPGNITISLFLGALKLFFLLFHIFSRLHSFIKVKFSKVTKLKMSHPKEQL